MAGTPTENTAHGSVWPTPDGKAVLQMDEDYKTRLVAYRTTMSFATGLLAGGIISEQDYAKIDRIIANQNGLSLSSICCRKPLIYQGFRGNIRPTKGGGSDGTDDP